MPKYTFRPLLQIFSKPVVESLPNSLPAMARPEERSCPERVDRGSGGVEWYPRIEEVEIEYLHEGIE
jgi:hypothetical protein